MNGFEFDKILMEHKFIFNTETISEWHFTWNTHPTLILRARTSLSHSRIRISSGTKTEKFVKGYRVQMGDAAIPLLCCNFPHYNLEFKILMYCWIQAENGNSYKSTPCWFVVSPIGHFGCNDPFVLMDSLANVSLPEKNLYCAIDLSDNTLSMIPYSNFCQTVCSKE